MDKNKNPTNKKDGEIIFRSKCPKCDCPLKIVSMSKYRKEEHLKEQKEKAEVKKMMTINFSTF